MKKLIWGVLLLLIIVASFATGSWYTQRSASTDRKAPSRKILYYVDPMHPAYKSDKPGIAPDCGMELVPVYDDGVMGDGGKGVSGPPGTVTISAATQQMVGVRTARVERKAATHVLRIVGRVAAAEDRTYKIIAANEGWVGDDAGPTSGSLVKKDDRLASLFYLDTLTAQQNYLLALQAHGWPQGTKQPTSPSAAAYKGVEWARSALRNLGMTDQQIEELSGHRMATAEIMLAVPASGMVVARNVSPGQRVERGAELYRIADLSQVWILADVFRTEAQHFQPGTVARVSLPGEAGEALHARVSKVLPQFDPTTRTLKVRLEADNPGFVLRPEMFVDVEFPIARPPALVVPVDAVVDSGVKKRVYVAKGDGVFEPRTVETGWRAGDQVEIVKGLMVGEQIVDSGTFLIDSESRMKAAAAGIYGETSDDPVCGMEVDQVRTKAAGLTAEYKGQTYYFCSDDCKTKFGREPTKHAWKGKPSTTTPAGKRLSEIQWDKGKATEKESAYVGHMHSPAPSGGK
jgi:membrane fusion protein, copper/silver efflux system